MKELFSALTAIGLFALSSPVLANDNEQGECGIPGFVVDRIRTSLRQSWP